MDAGKSPPQPILHAALAKMVIPTVLRHFEAEESCDEPPPLRELGSTKLPALALYERGVPAALQVHPHALMFYVVFVRFKLVKEGRDPLQRYATEYSLLLPAEIDSSILASLDIQLYLQDYSVVSARLETFELVRLESAQLELATRFTRWVFDLVLGRSLEETTSIYEDGPKVYYVLPLVNDLVPSAGRDFVSLVDWDIVSCALNSGLRYKMWRTIPSAYADVIDDLVVDGLVNYEGVPHLVVASVPREDSSNENLLDACKLYRAISYLTEHGRNGNFELPKKMNLVRLPVNKCIYFRALRGTIYRGALRLPSFLYRLEAVLLAAELRDKVDILVSPYKILEALTSRACGLDISYESLELLGDSVLKLTVGTNLYATHPRMNNDDLGLELYRLVCNKALSLAARARKLHQYVSAEMFSPSKWLSPGQIPSHDPCRHARQLLSSRTLADVVEAMIGASAVEGGLLVAKKTLRWFRIPVEWPSSITALDLQFSPVEPRNFDLQGLQDKIRYKFKDERFLLAALNFEADDFNFKRLEFLGDAVLDYLTTSYFVKTFPKLSAGELNILKQASVNREHYACICVWNGLHTHVKCSTSSSAAEISSFAQALLDECEDVTRRCTLSYGISSQASPKVLGDLMQTIAGAIFVDASFDLEAVWKVYNRLLEPFATPDTVVLHPIDQLSSLCKQQGLALEIECVEFLGDAAAADDDGGGVRGTTATATISTTIVQADVRVNKKMLSRSRHEERRVARRLAAMQALAHLLRS